MVKDKYQRFVNEILRTDDRIKLFMINLRLALYDYYDSMYDELQGVEDDNEYLGVLGFYSSPRNFEAVAQEVKKVTKLYEAELKEIKPRFGVNEEDAALTTATAKNVQTLIVSNSFNAIVSATSILALSLPTGRTPNRKDLRSQSLEPKLRETETQLTTAIDGYRSSMEIRKANELESKPRFSYVGPRDNKNRPLCRYILDHQQTWSEKEIKELDKHPDANQVPVMVYRGGYNCRHRWIYTERQ